MAEEKFDRDLIDRYLAGRLSKEETDAFEKAIKGDPELQNEIQLHREIALAVQEKDVMAFRASVKSALDELTASPKISAPPVRMYLMVAASAILLFLAGWTAYTFLFDSPSHEELYSRYFKPYPDLISGRNDAPDNDMLSDLMFYYNQQDYQNAVKTLEQLQSVDKPLIRLYAGIAYLNTDHLTEAKEAFAAVADTQKIYRNEALWYLSLTYLREQKQKEAQRLLKVIITEGREGLYLDNAVSLLKEIKRSL